MCVALGVILSGRVGGGCVPVLQCGDVRGLVLCFGFGISRIFESISLTLPSLCIQHCRLVVGWLAELVACKCRAVLCAGVGWNEGLVVAYRLQYADVIVCFVLVCLFGF